MTDRASKPAAWAVTHNYSLWPYFDPFADDAVIVEWSLADNYRTRDLMAPGDRAVFWETDERGFGGIARIGFVIDVVPRPNSGWEDRRGRWHDADYMGGLGLPRGLVTSDLWCREALLEGCSPCPSPIPVSSATT